LLQLTGCGPKARPAAAGCYAQTTSNKSADHYWLLAVNRTLRF
jgi:hypothetical protein